MSDPSNPYHDAGSAGMGSRSGMIQPAEPLPSPLGILFPDRRRRSGSKGDSTEKLVADAKELPTVEEAVVLEDHDEDTLLPSETLEAFSRRRRSSSSSFPLSLPSPSSTSSSPRIASVPESSAVPRRPAPVAVPTSASNASSAASTTTSYYSARSHLPSFSACATELLSSDSASSSRPSTSMMPTPELVASSSGMYPPLSSEDSSTAGSEAASPPWPRTPRSITAGVGAIGVNPNPVAPLRELPLDDPSATEPISLARSSPSSSAVPLITHRPLKKSPSLGVTTPLAGVDLPPSIPVLRLSSEDFARLEKLKVRDLPQVPSPPLATGEKPREREVRSKPPVTRRDAAGEVVRAEKWRSGSVGRRSGSTARSSASSGSTVAI